MKQNLQISRKEESVGTNRELLTKRAQQLFVVYVSYRSVCVLKGGEEAFLRRAVKNRAQRRSQAEQPTSGRHHRPKLQILILRNCFMFLLWKRLLCPCLQGETLSSGCVKFSTVHSVGSLEALSESPGSVTIFCHPAPTHLQTQPLWGLYRFQQTRLLLESRVYVPTTQPWRSWFHSWFAARPLQPRWAGLERSVRTELFEKLQILTLLSWFGVQHQWEHHPYKLNTK